MTLELPVEIMQLYDAICSACMNNEHTLLHVYIIQGVPLCIYYLRIREIR